MVARGYMEEAELQAGTTLRLAVSALDGHLKRYEALPALIADHEQYRGADPRPRRMPALRASDQRLSQGHQRRC